MTKKHSLKFEIAKYLVLFGILIIILLTVFQVFLLQPMYQSSKVNTVQSISDDVIEAIETDKYDEQSFQTYIMNIQVETDTCVKVASLSDPFGPNKQMKEPSGCFFFRMTPESEMAMIQKAMANEEQENLEIEQLRMARNEDEDMKSITYTKIIEANDNEYVVMVNGRLTPIDATIDTLKKQLIYIGVIIAAAIAILTVILNKMVAKPLSLINDSAKSLPEGHYEVKDNTSNFLEAAELNQTLVVAAEDINKADKAKRELIANVSHDLRTPLTMISGYGEMMIDFPEENNKENIQVIIDESQRLNNLVNDLLDLSKLQDQKIELNESVFNLTELINQQLKKYEVYIVRDGFKIEAFLADDVYVKADPLRIQQVFNNFMNNAINYSDTDKHIIVREIVMDDTVQLQVQDFGKGMAEEDIPHIWDRYYKVDKEHVRAESGSGIGLAIVKEILDLHKLKYGVTSSVGKGSTFWIEFPLEKEYPQQKS